MSSIRLIITSSGAFESPCATVLTSVPVPAYLVIENPAVVLAVSLVAGKLPANADPRFAPSIFTLPAVGVAPSPAELSAVGVPPDLQDQAT